LRVVTTTRPGAGFDAPLRAMHPDEVIARPAQPSVAIQVREYMPLHGDVRSGGAPVLVPRGGVAVEVAFPRPGLRRPLRGLARTRCGMTVVAPLRAMHPDAVIARSAQPAVAIQVRRYRALRGDVRSGGAAMQAPHAIANAEVASPLAQGRCPAQ